MDFDTVCVVGLGYVGLPTAAILASRGIRVTGADVNAETVALINQGRIHIVEPDLDIMVQATVQTGRLRATTRPQPADAFIVAVPTPFTDGHKPDLSFLEAATRSIAPVLKKGDLVVVESTLPVGTTERVAAWLAAARPDLRLPRPGAADEADIYVAHCPERVLPGQVLVEMVRNDRVVGGITPRCAARAAALYRRFVNGACIETTARTAELVKLAENAYRDVNIAFANELSLVCDAIGVDVWDTIAIANRHPRVDILKPGPGVGGHCIAVDPWFIVDSAPELTPLIQAARHVNDGKPEHVVSRIVAAVEGHKRPRIACLGLSYKANIDDLRESPAVHIVARLAERLAGRGDIMVVEPHVAVLPAELAGLPGVRQCDLSEALGQAEVVALLVDHRDFAAIDRKLLAGRTVIDTRGLWRDHRSS